MSCSNSPDDLEDLLYRIAELMNKKDLSISAFGRLAGVTGATVSNWLSGKSRPSRPTIKRLEQVVKGMEITRTVRKITVKQAAECIGASEQFVRVGLQKGRLPIGAAVMEDKNWVYHISPHLLREYIGDEDFDGFFK